MKLATYVLTVTRWEPLKEGKFIYAYDPVMVARKRLEGSTYEQMDTERNRLRAMFPGLDVIVNQYRFDQGEA